MFSEFHQKLLSPDYATDDGQILSFDLPCFESYNTKKPPLARVVREGRLKQLSSIHRLFAYGKLLSGLIDSKPCFDAC